MMLDLAYDRDSFISGSSILSITVYEAQLWNYYTTYVKRDKTDRLEYVMLTTAQGACANKFKKQLKPQEMILQPVKPKQGASSMLKKMMRLKPKGNKDGKQ